MPVTAKLSRQFYERLAGFETRLAEFEVKIERRLGEQTRFFFVAWASLLVPIIGLWFRR